MVSENKKSPLFKRVGDMPNLDRVDALYCVLAIQDGKEGLPAVQTHGVMMPLIGADINNLDTLRQYARTIASGEEGVTCQIVKFCNRELIEEIKP